MYLIRQDCDFQAPPDNSDYETIYVFHITRKGQNGIRQATLEIQQEDLTNSLSDTCPGPK